VPKTSPYEEENGNRKIPEQKGECIITRSDEN
jgi:hypothetical protein